MAAAGIVLHPACRVRQEGFGLLFYDSRGPRLLFAETGSLIAPEFFEGTRPVTEMLEGLDNSQRGRVLKFLTQLIDKGFLREQPIC